MDKLLSLLSFLLVAGCTADQNAKDHARWEARGGGPASIRYSSLDQIDTTNVDQLEVAWTYHTGDANSKNNSQIQANPIIIDGTLYGTSPQLKAFAVDAATGEEQWVFDPLAALSNEDVSLNANRGVTYWEDGQDRRILMTAGATLIALDADNGTLIDEFGDDGTVSLKTGLDARAEDLYVSATSPGVIYEDLLILGSSVREGNNAAPGDIRAFNVRTGELEWAFHTIPRPGEFGRETWEDPKAWKRVGGANSWAGMAVDEERGIVYVPTGSATPDFYGANRKGKNLFANCLLALDASTGERIWHYQTVHHDLWDRDLPAPPSLVTVEHDGEQVDAVAQTTKTGYIFLFNRVTGEPLFPIEEVSVPTESPLEGEEPWPTQPKPTTPEPYVRQHMGPEDVNPYVSDSVQTVIREKLESLNKGHLFEPPSRQGTLLFPGFSGGAEWGGAAFDPQSDVLYVNSNSFPSIIDMVPIGDTSFHDHLGSQRAHFASSQFSAGRSRYRANCMSCHGPDREGDGNYPSLVDVEQRLSPQEMIDIINNGRRRMPGFDNLTESEKKAIVNFLLEKKHFSVDADDLPSTSTDNAGAAYVMAGYLDFRLPEGWVPAVSPPWGTLNAINLSTGDYLWRKPLGEYPAWEDRDIPTTGADNFGGPAVTTGGLVFIAATPDAKLRAFNKRTGDVVWSADLPAAGFATPSIYEVDEKQYIVIACGGGKVGTPSGDEYVAFALPKR